MDEKSIIRLNGYNVEIEVDEDGRHLAECTDLPGCVSDGATKQEALRNITDAIGGYLTAVSKNV